MDMMPSAEREPPLTMEELTVLRPDVALTKPLRRPPLWSSHLAGAHEKPAFDQAGRVAKLALGRRRVQWHCSRAPTSEPFFFVDQ